MMDMGRLLERSFGKPSIVPAGCTAGNPGKAKANAKEFSLAEFPSPFSWLAVGEQTEKS
jgi:hypothetical protein